MIFARRTIFVAAIEHRPSAFELVSKHRRAARLASNFLRPVPRHEVAGLAAIKISVKRRRTLAQTLAALRTNFIGKLKERPSVFAFGVTRTRQKISVATVTNQHLAPALFANFIRLDNGLVLRLSVFAERSHRLVKFFVELRAIIFNDGNFFQPARRDLCDLRVDFVVSGRAENFSKKFVDRFQDAFAQGRDFVNRIFRRDVFALDEAGDAD